MANKRITLEHIHAAGLCSSGSVLKLKALGLTRAEIMAALANGLDVDRARGFNDALVNKVIAVAEKEWSLEDGEG